MKKLLFLVLVLLVGTEGWGQVLRCGSSSISENMTPQQIFEEQKLDSIRRLSHLNIRTSLAQKTIPVVVHVLYKYANEKIPLKQVEDAIEHLKQAYSGKEHYSTGLNTDFSFCLVYTDWILSDKTNFRFEDKVDLSAIQNGGHPLGWDKDKFLNIYVVNSVSQNGKSKGGFAYLPGLGLLSDFLNNPGFDGIVIDKNGVGVVDSKGIPQPLLPHEVGHYLGLYHTFEGECSNSDCKISGDKVCDTPPCKNITYEKNLSHPEPYNTCELGGNDLEDNFMCYNDEYAEPIKFTQGQIIRMHNIVNENRPKLSLTNGCLDITDQYFEPNESIGGANRTFPLIYQGFKANLNSYIQNSNDDDYYAINLITKGKLKITLSGLSQNLNLKLINILGKVEEESSNTTNKDEIVYFRNPEISTPLFILVESVGVTSPTPYKLTVELLPCSDDEPNNSTSTATEAFPTLGSKNTEGAKTIKSVISSGLNEQDWYKLNLQGQGTLRVDLKTLPKNYNIELMDSKGKQVINSNGIKIGSYNTGTTNELFTFQNITSDVYYIRVFPAFVLEFDICSPYTLTATWTPDAPCEAITVSKNIINASTANSTDGSITLKILTGKDPKFKWSNGATTPSISNLGDDTYKVTITGLDGCIEMLPYTVGTGVNIPVNETPYCSGYVTLTMPTGTINDKSGTNDYKNNSFCRWVIVPPNADKITLDFISFKMHSTDKVKVFDGENSLAPVIAEFTGSALPPSVTSTKGKMYVQFITDGTSTSEGFSASYKAIIDDGLNQITSYDLWFDNQFENKYHDDLDPRNTYTIKTNVSTNELSVGVHTINIRFNDQYNQSSPITTDLFVKMPQITEGPDVGIVGYEYWLDNNFDNRTNAGFSPVSTFDFNEAVDVNDLSYGLHAFNMRFMDNTNNWSATSTDLFVKEKVSASGSRKIVGYEYWYDDKLSNKINQTVTPTETYTLLSNLDVTALSLGLHAFNCRFLDDAGEWSPTTTDLFLKAKSNNNLQIVGYEYWYDDKFGNKISQAVTPTETYTFIANLDVSALSYGLHAFNFRFQEAAGEWSVTSTDLFVRTKSTANTKIAGYEYWFDDKFNNKTTQAFAPTDSYDFNANLDVSALPYGLHAFNFRFQDAAGQWSITSTDLFIKERNSATGSKKIVSYQYWFDENYQGKVSLDITPTVSYDLVRTVSTIGLLSGAHTISFRFLDNTNQWSPIIREPFNLSGALPVELTQFKGNCQNGKVSLNWTTASEQNSSYFEILHSLSPQTGWKLAEVQKAQGNSTTITEYAAKYESLSHLTYYRLRQVDRDGKAYYSKTISVECEGKEHYIKVFPNPTSEGLFLLEADITEGVLNVELFNLVGQSIQKNTFGTGVYPIEVPLTNVATGATYIVKVTTGKGEVLGVQKLIVH
jgi:Pregnancy-associated plasma protein-A/CUB domain/Secretion system C-terminal sorting domain